MCIVCIPELPSIHVQWHLCLSNCRVGPLGCTWWLRMWSSRERRTSAQARTTTPTWSSSRGVLQDVGGCHEWKVGCCSQEGWAHHPFKFLISISCWYRSLNSVLLWQVRMSFLFIESWIITIFWSIVHVVSKQPWFWGQVFYLVQIITNSADLLCAIMFPYSLFLP